MATNPDRTQHTPGPWQAHDGWITAEPEHGIGGEACVIAQMHSGPDCAPAEQADANAHLLAAAPDLLQAAKAVRVLWFKYGLGHDDAESEPIWQALNRAINKAKGW